MLKPLLLCALIGLFVACNQPKGVFQESPYDSELNRVANSLTGTKKKTKHLRGLETVFQQAQHLDLVLVDSLLEENRPDLWPAVNALYRRLQIRQRKITALQPLRAKNGYEPTLPFVPNIAEKEAESRRNAATYLYDKAQKLLVEAEKGNRPAAREALFTLQDLKQHYYLYWENANALLDSARILGISHILLTNLPATPPWTGPVFWKEVSAQSRRLNDEWHTYYFTFSPNQPYDYVVECQVKSIQVGSESRSESTTTEEKDIEKGFEEKKDTVGNVIERKPIYEHVKAEIRKLSLSRRAEGVLAVAVHNIHDNALVLSKNLPVFYNYSADFTYVSGDQRALSSSIISSADLYPSAPSEDRMSEHLLGDMQSDLFYFLKKHLVKR